VNQVIVWVVAGVEFAGLVALAVLLIVARQKLKSTRRELERRPVHDGVGSNAGIRFGPPREVELKGFQGTHTVYAVVEIDDVSKTPH
jgi:hypothetical protein